MLKSLAIQTASPGPTPASHPHAEAQAWRMRLRDLDAILSLWLHRGRSRCALAALDERQLRDLGLTRAAALRESAKPFWRA